MSSGSPQGPYGPPPAGAVPPSPWTAPPAHGPVPHNPVSAVGYWLGGAAMVLGVAVAIVAFVVSINRAVEALQFPDVVDTAGGVWVDDPGGHVIFVVRPGQIGNSFTPRPSISVTDPSGEPVATEPYSGSRISTGTNRTTGMTREAVAVATFHADRAGRYHLEAPDLTGGTTLAVGNGADGKFGTIALVLVGSGLLAIVGLVVVIVTAVRRRKRPYPPGPGGWGGYGPPPTMMAPPGAQPWSGAPPWTGPPTWSAPQPGTPPQPGGPGGAGPGPAPRPHGQPDQPWWEQPRPPGATTDH